MKLPLATRIGRLERQRDVLRGQLPFAGPGQSERRYLAELLSLVGSALFELRRRQGVQRRRELMATAADGRTGRTVSCPPARQRVARFLTVSSPAPVPMLAAWRPAPDGPLEYEVVWPRSVAS